MALDMTVMNTAIATVAEDVGTDVIGIQTAITLYTLVMASFMITCGRAGEIIGRKRAFTIGCIVYACGSLTTALSHIAGGNSNGDIPMLDFAHHRYKPPFRLLVLHDDAERDFAYTSGAERALKKADTSGWTVVSMKDDFATVFAAADREDATAARPAVNAV